MTGRLRRGGRRGWLARTLWAGHWAARMSVLLPWARPRAIDARAVEIVTACVIRVFRMASVTPVAVDHVSHV